MQQPDQLNAMAFLTAYLQEAQQQQQAQAQQQAQQQAQSQPASHAASLPFDQSWPSAMSERQQLAFRSLSEAAADRAEGHRSGSEMLRASLNSPTVAPATSSFPGDILTAQASPHQQQLSAAATAGLCLAQQSLLYAPSRQEQDAAQRNHQLFQQHQFAPQSFPTRNPLGSSRNSLDTGFRWSDPGRRPSFSHHDWMSTGSGPSRYSIESDFVTTGRRSSVGPLPMRSSVEVDWAGRPIARPDAVVSLTCHRCL